MIDNGLDRVASPILPKVKLAFPTIMSDEEDELPIWNGLSGSVGRRGPNLSNRSEGGRDSPGSRSRTWSQNSQTTTTTTLRTKKTEHRSYRYSMPSFDALNDEYGTTSNEVTPRSHSSTSGSNPTHSSTPTKNSTNSNSQIPFPTSGSNRRTTTTSFHNPTPRSTKTSVPIRETRRSSPLPPFPPSLNSTSIPSKSTSSNPFDAIFHRRPSNNSNRTSSYHSHISDSSSFDPPNSRSNQMRTSMRNASLPLVAPLMNMFMFFIVTSIACCSISAVLAAGFGLTLYDDCGRRVKLLREGIEGVSLTNMGRIVGGAVGEWAKEATKRLKAGSSGIRTVRVRVNRRRDESSEEEEGEGNDRESRSTSPMRTAFDSEEINSDGLRYKSNFERNMNSRSRSRIRRKSNSPAVSSAPSSTGILTKRFPTRFFPRFFTSTPEQRFRNEDLSNQVEDWFSDEDNLPFEVPTSTPHPSRPSSPPPSPAPSPSPPLTSTSSSSSQSSSKPTRPLPPRPPYSLLVPSIIFALIYTLLKVTFDYWRGNRRPRAHSRN